MDPKTGRSMSLSEVAQNQERKRSVQHDEAVVPPKVEI
jgi:SP family sugar:H+ symporter-like MFS transporter